VDKFHLFSFGKTCDMIMLGHQALWAAHGL
jgi:hypothetical protein